MHCYIFPNLCVFLLFYITLWHHGVVVITVLSILRSHFWYIFLFLQNNSIFFHDILHGYSCCYSDSHTKDRILDVANFGYILLCIEKLKILSWYLHRNSLYYSTLEIWVLTHFGTCSSNINETFNISTWAFVLYSFLEK